MDQRNQSLCAKIYEKFYGSLPEDFSEASKTALTSLFYFLDSCIFGRPKDEYLIGINKYGVIDMRYLNAFENGEGLLGANWTNRPIPMEYIVLSDIAKMTYNELDCGDQSLQQVISGSALYAYCDQKYFSKNPEMYPSEIEKKIVYENIAPCFDYKLSRDFYDKFQDLWVANEDSVSDADVETKRIF